MSFFKCVNQSIKMVRWFEMIEAIWSLNLTPDVIFNNEFEEQLKIKRKEKNAFFFNDGNLFR